MDDNDNNNEKIEMIPASPTASISSSSNSSFLDRLEVKKTDLTLQLMDIVDDVFGFFLKEMRPNQVVEQQRQRKKPRPRPPTPLSQSPTAIERQRVPKGSASSVSSNTFIIDETDTIEFIVSESPVTSEQVRCDLKGPPPNNHSFCISDVTQPECSPIKSNSTLKSPVSTLPMIKSSNNEFAGKIANFLMDKAMNFVAGDRTSINNFDSPIGDCSNQSTAMHSPLHTSTVFCCEHRKRNSSPTDRSPLVFKKLNSSQTLDPPMISSIIPQTVLNKINHLSGNCTIENDYKDDEESVEATGLTSGNSGGNLVHDELCLCDQCLVDSLLLDEDSNVEHSISVFNVTNPMISEIVNASTNPTEVPKQELKENDQEDKDELDSQNESQVKSTFSCWRRQCKRSAVTFDTRTDLDHHLRSVHFCVIPTFEEAPKPSNRCKPTEVAVSGQFQCSHCPKQWKSRASLYQHEYNYHQSGSFRCVHTECQFVGTLRSDLRRHMYKHHSRHQCPAIGCGRSFAVLAHLTTHQTTQHPHLTSIGSATLSTTTSNSSNNSNNNNSDQSTTGQKAAKRPNRGSRRALREPKPFRCGWFECDYSSKQKGRVLRHINDHLDQTRLLRSTATNVTAEDYLQTVSLSSHTVVN